MARPTRMQEIVTLLSAIIIGGMLIFLYLTYNPDFSTVFFAMVILTIALLALEYFLIKPDQSIPLYNKRYGFFTSIVFGIIGLGGFLISSFLTTPFVTGISRQVFGFQSIFALQAQKAPIFKDNVFLTYFSSGVLVGFVENLFFFSALMILVYWIVRKPIGAGYIPSIVISVIVCSVLFMTFHFGVNLITTASQAQELCQTTSTTICTSMLLWNNFLWGLCIGTFNWITGNLVGMWGAHGFNDALVTKIKYEAAKKLISGGLA